MKEAALPLLEDSRGDGLPLIIFKAKFITRVFQTK